MRSTNYVAIIGGANIDIGGTSYLPLTLGDSNPGIIRSSLGGVGRNIAQNLSQLGVNVKLITALGTDVAAARICDSCRRLNIDISRSLQVPGGNTSTYLYINSPDGDISLAVNDMKIYEQITPDYLASQIDFLCNAAVVVVDANLTEKSIAYLADHCTAPLYGDTVSLAKAIRFSPVLGKFHTLKPNRKEAELLSGIPIVDENSLYASAQALLDTGLHEVFISLGENGVLAANNSQKRILKNLPFHLVNATGCGDAFMAALVFSALENADLIRAAQTGLAAASLVGESYESIAPQMSTDAIKARLEMFN